MDIRLLYSIMFISPSLQLAPYKNGHLDTEPCGLFLLFNYSLYSI